ncbi:hypothetical protein SK128_005618 [Halocaridina rubra]|uniref:Chitin-binding type-2 domain-containing protein n=1 Tax=Halocaridina rubra TaxID=373956 RepID=A0AAN8XNJ3_HALRR
MPDCSAANPGDKVPDPVNCTNYYFCLADHNPSDLPLPCPPGTSFPTDGTGTDCTGTVPCDPICGGGGGVACHITCNGTGDYISDPFDCGTYYECDAAGPIVPGRVCPPDRPHFDGESCVNNADICCYPGCSPVCEAAATQIPDPTDCTKFYICTEAGTPDESLHFPCPPGQNFDIGSGHCTAAAECKILCTSTSAVGGVTTTGVGSVMTTGGGGSTGGIQTTGECMGTLTCPDVGFYAKCITCQPEYFYCSSAGAVGSEQRCSDGLVFNPVPEYPYCILPNNCPYTP